MGWRFGGVVDMQVRPGRPACPYFFTADWPWGKVLRVAFGVLSRSGCGGPGGVSSGDLQWEVFPFVVSSPSPVIFCCFVAAAAWVVAFGGRAYIFLRSLGSMAVGCLC